MKSFSSNFFTALLLTLAACPICLAQDLFNAKEPLDVPFLQKLDPAQHIGGYPILNIGSELGIIHLKTSYSPGTASGVPIGNAAFLDIRDNKFFASMDVQANLANTNASDWTDEPCKREDFLWKRSTGGQFSKINCATINHITKYFTNPSGAFQQYLVKFRELGIDIAPTVIRVEFTRYSENGRRLVYKVYLNPEAFGFDRDAEPIWGANSWHKSFINKNPKKVEFIANLSKWAEAVQDKMDAAFNKKLDAFSSVPPLASFIKQ